MKHFRKTKTTAILAALGALLVAGGAYAFWTAGGSGSGSATNATTNGTTTLKATFADGLTPGKKEDVTYTASNPGTSSLRINTIKATVRTSDPGCRPADFVVPDTASNTTVPPGAQDVPAGSTTITFTDTAQNQDACKGATITLDLSST